MESLLNQETCPECKLFKFACECDQPWERRLPTEREIRAYLGLLGPYVNDGFIGGFQSGWCNHNTKIKEIFKALVKELTDNPKHNFSYAELLRLIVKYFGDIGE